MITACRYLSCLAWCLQAAVIAAVMLYAQKATIFYIFSSHSNALQLFPAHGLLTSGRGSSCIGCVAMQHRHCPCTICTRHFSKVLFASMPSTTSLSITLAGCVPDTPTEAGWLIEHSMSRILCGWLRSLVHAAKSTDRSAEQGWERIMHLQRLCASCKHSGLCMILHDAGGVGLFCVQDGLC